jgi:hypothetical protein
MEGPVGLQEFNLAVCNSCGAPAICACHDRALGRVRAWLEGLYHHPCQHLVAAIGDFLLFHPLTGPAITTSVDSQKDQRGNMRLDFRFCDDNATLELDAGIKLKQQGMRGIW